MLLTTLFKTHTAEAFQPLLLNLAPAVVTAVNDSFYKVAAEGLRTVTRMVGVMRPQLEKPVRLVVPTVVTLCLLHVLIDSIFAGGARAHKRH